MAEPGTSIQLRSSTFIDHDVLPRQTSKEGDNAAPALEWNGLPEGTAELELVCEDPDAPGGTFLHWMVTGIDPSTSGIGGGEFPDGAVQARNSFGELGWGGPYPPAGDPTHRYFFRVYAANRPLGLGPQATPDDLYDALDEHELARGTLVGLYQR